MEYQYYQLSNGIRIIHKPVVNQVAHCGIIIGAGSRDELPDENGIAHFIEHVIFKGTRHRKAYHILSRLENVGGELNAYTSKEETCIYASFLKQYYPRTLELFSDILNNSLFPPKEIQKEKDVVIDEINSYKDSPFELIFDEFEELLYDGHPIGRCILGTPESVKAFTREHVVGFMKRNYVPEKMVICSVGNIRFEKLISLAEKYFGFIGSHLKTNTQSAFVGYMPQKRVDEKSNFQVHCIMGNLAYDVNNDKKTILGLLTNILGGPGMNSRLNLGIREKYGYSYNIEAHYQPYSDTGNFNIYLGTDNGYLEKSVKLVYRELKLLRDKKLGSLQLHRAKLQLIGQMAISLESNLNEMISIGKSHLFFDHVDSFGDMITKVNTITSGQLLEVANEIFTEDQFSMLTFIPKKES
nr:insulinase family protein [Bacteroidota bacterium]